MFLEFRKVKNDAPTNLVDPEILAMWAVAELVDCQFSHRLVLDFASGCCYMLQLDNDDGFPLGKNVKASLCFESEKDGHEKSFDSLLDATKALAEILGQGDWYSLYLDAF